MARRPTLTADQKLFVVQRAACFDSPDVIVKAFKEEFGFDISKQSCENYDPTKVNGQNLSQKFKDVFYETRKRFTEDFSSIPIANKSYRLRMLDRMAKTAESKGNMGMAASLAEQAAKEVGDAYSNTRKHEVTGKDGEPLAKSFTPADYAAAQAAVNQSLSDLD